MRFSTLTFFHQSIPLRSLINKLNHFCIWFWQIHREICKYTVSNSALWCIARNRNSKLCNTVRSWLCTIQHNQSQQENFWLVFHTELHSTVTGKTCWEKKIRAIHYGTEFFCTARSQNTNVSAFVAAVEVTVKQKRTIGDFAYPMAVK
jgi:hypothetical protein